MIGVMGVKRVQSGVTAGATTVTIDAVNMAKAFVISVSKGSSGSVAARGSMDTTGHLMGFYNGMGPMDLRASSGNYGGLAYIYPADNINAHVSMNQSGSISGGTTDLTTKQYSAKLISPTQLQTDGAVEWQVIEYN